MHYKKVRPLILQVSATCQTEVGPFSAIHQSTNQLFMYHRKQFGNIKFRLLLCHSSYTTLIKKG